MRWLAALVFIAIVLTASLPVQLAAISASGQSADLAGSVWTYNYYETISGTSMNLQVDGTMRQQYLGIQNITYREPTVAETYYQSIRANVTGWVNVQDFFVHRYDVKGTYSVTEYDYFDVQTLHLLKTDVHEEMSLKQAQDTRQSISYYEEDNVTTYSNVTTEPEESEDLMYAGLLDSGSTWSTEYFGHSNVSGVESTIPFDRSYRIHEWENCTYLGREKTVVNAGTFDCYKLRYQYSDYNLTLWVSTNVGAPVRSETSVTAGHQVRITLLAYHIERGAAEEPSLPWVAFGAGLAVAAVAVVVVIAFLMKSRSRPAERGKEIGEGGVDRI